MYPQRRQKFLAPCQRVGRGLGARGFWWSSHDTSTCRYGGAGLGSPLIAKTLARGGVLTFFSTKLSRKMAIDHGCNYPGQTKNVHPIRASTNPFESKSAGRSRRKSQHTALPTPILLIRQRCQMIFGGSVPLKGVSGNCSVRAIQSALDELDEQGRSYGLSLDPKESAARGSSRDLNS